MMLKLFVVAFVVAAVVADLDTEWSHFKVKYNKKYRADEEAYRKETWSKNMETIEKHNMKHRLNMSSYTLGENEYADMTSREFAVKRANVKTTVYCPGSPASSGETQTFIKTPFPPSVDWRKQGFVTAVKDQGNCNSGWAFSATGVLEGRFANTSGLVSVSESNLIDCTSDGNQGCDGGSSFKGLTFAWANKGINTEASYPYKPEQGPCKFDKTTAVPFHDIPYGMENFPEKYLQIAVVYYGPTSAFIDAGLESFHLYKSGIYDDPKCNPTAYHHGILVVGYGTDDDKDYWVVKNSWGTSWGEEGYVRISRNNNQCGIANCIAYVVPS